MVIFAIQWKKEVLVLVPKSSKPHGEPSLNRPICLFDSIGMLLERIIYNRLLPIAEEAVGMSAELYSFRTSP